jgi:hypothetical protein
MPCGIILDGTDHVSFPPQLFYREKDILRPARPVDEVVSRTKKLGMSTLADQPILLPIPLVQPNLCSDCIFVCSIFCNKSSIEKSSPKSVSAGLDGSGAQYRRGETVMFACAKLWAGGVSRLHTRSSSRIYFTLSTGMSAIHASQKQSLC